MKIIVIDGQGGGIGKSLIEALRRELPEQSILAIGINALATAAMLRGGANAGVTGENAIRYNCLDADVIVGPIGIVLANAMMGEVSPEIAQAVGSSKAKKILIPVAKCQVYVTGGAEKLPLAKQIEEAAAYIKTLSNEK